MQLGDRVKDTITGFEGIIVGKTVYLNGCVRFAVQGQELKDGLPTEVQWIDEAQVALVKAGEHRFIEVELFSIDGKAAQPPGGPRFAPTRSADPRR